ncbi:hypothetical protein ES705_21971 [subsurface metagenome]
MIQRKTDKGTITIKNSERQECEIWSRVMGYYRPVSEFNIGKKSEFKERVYFSEEKAVLSMEEKAK